MMSLPSSSSQEQYHVQPSMHAPSFASHSHSVDSSINLADQPLNFAPTFSRDSDLQMQSTYNHHDSASSMNNWGAPVAPGVVYPPIHPSHPSGPQVINFDTFCFFLATSMFLLIHLTLG